MNKILALGAILAGLAGCSSSSDPAANIDSTITNALLNGTWASDCIAEGTGSSKVLITFNNGNGIFDSTTYLDTICTAAGAANPRETFTYIIGGEVTVDGSIAGITTATKIDITDTTQGAPTAGTKNYDIFAIANLITLYAGDDTGANDGSTAALRPTKLSNRKFTQL